MLNFYQSLVVDVLKVLQLPGDVEGDVDGPGADGECGGDVALQGVADHQEFRGMDLLMFAEVEELTLRLVGGDLHVVEVFQQTRPFQLILLILQLAFGEDHHFATTFKTTAKGF